MTPQDYPLLGNVAVEAGVLSADELDDVLQKAAERSVPLGEMLFKLGYVSRDRLVQLLADQYQTTVFDLGAWQPDDALLTVLPSDFVREYNVLPVRMESGTLTLAGSGPFTLPVPDLLAHVARVTGLRAEIVMCDADALRRLIADHHTHTDPDDEPIFEEPDEASGVSVTEFSALIGEIRDDATMETSGETAVRIQLEDLLDAAFTTLIEVRAHPFMIAVVANTNTAAELLDKAKEHQHAGKYGEALTLARRANNQLGASLRKAEEVAQAWGPMLQQVEILRTRIAQFEAEDAGDFAPQEMGRLREVRDAMLEHIETKQVERLRVLVDEAQVLVERVGDMTPQIDRRSQVVEQLTLVREVLSRARKIGAQHAAPAAVDAAYRLLEAADAQAREGAWDQVQDSLAQARAHAEAAEEQALAASERLEETRNSVRRHHDAASEAVATLAAEPGAEVIADDLAGLRARLAEAKLAMAVDGDLQAQIEALTGLIQDDLPHLRARAGDAAQAAAALNERLDALVQMALEAAGSAAPGSAAEAIGRFAGHFKDFARAAQARNLSDATVVIQKADAELQDMLDTLQQAQGDQRGIEADWARADAALQAIEVHPAAGTLRDHLPPLRADLERATACLDEASWGDAAALVDGVEHAIAERLRPAIAEHERKLRSILERLGAFPRELVAPETREAAQVVPDTFAELVLQVEDATRAVAEGRAEDAARAVAAAEEASERLRHEAAEAMGRARATLESHMAEVDGRLQEIVGSPTGQTMPELLEEAYFDLNAARSLLNEQGAVISIVVAEQIDQHLRAADLTAQHVAGLGGMVQSQFGAAVAQFQAQVGELTAELDRLREEPDLGCDLAPLESATDALAEAQGALARDDLARGYELLRLAERHLEQARDDRECVRMAQVDVEAFFNTTMPEHLAALDSDLVYSLAPDAWTALQAIEPAVADARDMGHLQQLAELRERATHLLTECAAAQRSERSRRLVEVHEARAAALAAVRLARLLKAEERSADLFKAAAQLVDAADGDVQARRWDDARDQFAAAIENAERAQEAALQGARDALDAHQELVRAALSHLRNGNVDGAQAALAAASGAAEHAVIPTAGGAAEDTRPPSEAAGMGQV